MDPAETQDSGGKKATNIEEGDTENSIQNEGSENEPTIEHGSPGQENPEGAKRLKRSVHRIVHRVTTKIASLKSRFINMPTQEEFPVVANEFIAIAGFPRVVGTVDCKQSIIGERVA
ncbi:unnamed protein product [Colias eurytheme]|nr:unnamed protein product [Colias eurytheme]